MPLSVISAMTGLGLDPWAEALGCRPRKSARRLSSWFRRLPACPASAGLIGGPENRLGLIELYPRRVLLHAATDVAPADAPKDRAVEDVMAGLSPPWDGGACQHDGEWRPFLWWPRTIRAGVADRGSLSFQLGRFQSVHWGSAVE